MVWPEGGGVRGDCGVLMTRFPLPVKHLCQLSECAKNVQLHMEQLYAEVTAAAIYHFEPNYVYNVVSE